MKLYICGPMSGYPDHNRPAFRAASDALCKYYKVVDPSPYEAEGWTWADYLKRDLPLLLKCDGVATLPDWQCSKGASLEVYNAQQLDVPVMPVERWIERAA